MARKAFYFDSTRCVDCKTCQVACKKKNNLPAGITYRKVNSYVVGEYPDAKFYHISHTCNHCVDAACVANCPTGAMYRDEEDGTVQHDDEICIGCETCVKSCPYQVPVLLADKKVTGKCNACIDTRPEDGTPTCVAACGMRALEFGDYDELVAAHPEAVRDIACRPDSAMTDPSTIIMGRDCLQDDSFVDLLL